MRKEVTAGQPSFPQRSLSLSPFVAVIYLSLAMLVAFPFFAWYAGWRHGADGILAAAVAGGICWLGAAIALAVIGVMKGPENGVSGVLLGMIFRLGLPMGGGVLLSRIGGSLADAGVFGLIVAYYLVGLTVETLLAVRVIGSGGTVTGAR